MSSVSKLTEIICPACGHKNLINLNIKRDRGRYCRQCGEKISDALNPRTLTDIEIYKATEYLEIIMKDKDVIEGEYIFNELLHKFGLRLAETMSIVGGYMTRGIIYSPRPGLFKMIKNKRSCLRDNCLNIGGPECDMNPDTLGGCLYVRGHEVNISEWLK